MLGKQSYLSIWFLHNYITEFLTSLQYSRFFINAYSNAHPFGSSVILIANIFSGRDIETYHCTYCPKDIVHTRNARVHLFQILWYLLLIQQHANAVFVSMVVIVITSLPDSSGSAYGYTYIGGTDSSMLIDHLYHTAHSRLCTCAVGLLWQNGVRSYIHSSVIRLGSDTTYLAFHYHFLIHDPIMNRLEVKSKPLHHAVEQLSS